MQSLLFFFQAEDGIRDVLGSRGLGDVYKRQDYSGIYPKFDMERYEHLKEAFPEVNENAPMRRLSKGMQKQAAFWLALSCHP